MNKLKISRPILYSTLALVAVGAYLFTEDQAAQRARSVKRKPVASKSKFPEGYNETDFKAKFERLAEPIKDSFKPLVERKRGGSEVALSPNAAPSVLTGGDPNWVYTGMAEIDGAPTGLLENKVTGESNFVQRSENWKSARVGSITPYSLILIGDNGRAYTLRTGVEGDGPTLMAQGFSPVNPPLRGAIGAGIEVTPDASQQRRNRAVASRENGAGQPAMGTEAKDGEQR